MEAVAVRPVQMAMSAAIATANAHLDKVIALRMGTKDRNTQESVLSFLMSVLVFQASVPLETATVIRVSDHPDNLTTAVRVPKANDPLATTSRVLRARSTSTSSSRPAPSDWTTTTPASRGACVPPVRTEYRQALQRAPHDGERHVDDR